jgi:predicted permease
MLRAWLTRLRSMLERRRLDEEMDEEIRAHLELATEEYLRRGMSPEDARRAALRSFGGVEQVRERHREQRAFSFLDDIARDLRLAARTLGKERGFAVTAILTLTIAIGANTAIVSVVDAVLLRPLPYPDPDEVVTLGLRRSTGERTQGQFTVAAYGLLRDENESFQDLGAYTTSQAALTGAGEPMHASVSAVTNSVFAVLGLSPLVGRLPAAEEDLPAGPRVVVLSHGLWTTRFESDPAVVGRTIELNDTIRNVIGVMPEGFGFPSERVDAWVPLGLDPATQDTRAFVFRLVGRLRPGATPASASSDVDRLVRRLPEVGHASRALTTYLEGDASILPIKEDQVGDSRRLLLVLLGAVSLLLLIAFSNVAALFIVRAEERSQQRVVRSALGASRRRLVQHALGEALLVSLVGGLGGLLLALAGARALVDLAPDSIPRLDGVGLGTTVLSHTIGVSVLTAILFAVLPTLATRSTHGAGIALSAAGRSATAGRDRLRLRSALVAAQVGLAVVLLIGSMLVVRSYGRLRSVDPGFDPTSLVTFGLVLPATRYSGPEAVELAQRLVGSLRALPDVESAALSTGLPVTPLQAAVTLGIEGYPNDALSFVIRWVTPGYFEAMGIPVVAGRTMRADDFANSRGWFVTEAFAEEYIGDAASTVGRRIGPREVDPEVVGVVGDDQIRGLDIPTEAAVYAPMGTLARTRPMSAVVRTRSAVADIAPILRRTVAQLDPELPLIDIRPMEEIISESYAVSRTRFAMLLLVLCALVALGLGAVGIYGLISYAVSRRTSEIGVRIALGATSGRILARFAAMGVMPAVAGIAGGIVIAVLGSRALSSLLFQTDRLEPSTFLAGPAVLLAVAVIACAVPTRRAIAIDPMRALRSE